MQIDRRIVFELLKGTNRNVKEATKLLKESGVNIDEKELYDYIKSDPVLSYVYQGTGINDIEFPEYSERLVKQEDQIQIGITEQDRYLAANGFSGMGFDDDDIKQAMATAELSANAFLTTLEYAHGSLINCMHKIQKRLDWISENKIESDMITEEEALLYLKEYKGLMDTMRNMSETANRTGLTRLKVEDSRGKDGPKPAKPPLADGPG